MLKRYRAWRDRLTSEVADLGTARVRVTKRRGKIIGVELWHPLPGGCDDSHGYHYTVVR